MDFVKLAEVRLLNELEIIEMIRKMFEVRNHPLTDDVAYLANGWAYKVDMLVKSTDIPEGMNGFQIGRKSVAAVLSDLSTKGVKPKLMMLSFAFQAGITNEYVSEILRGIKEMTERYNITLIGGDVNKANDTVIDCIMVGRYKMRVLRSGAHEGDDVYVVGDFGLTTIGLDYLLNKKPIVNDKLKNMALKAVYEPAPSVNFNIEAINTGYVTSSMDSSDGLAYTLNEIAQQSNVKIVLNGYPMSNYIKKLIESEGRDPLNDSLYGGEEYQMVFTVKPEKAYILNKLAKKHKVKIFKIGKVEKGSGVYLNNGVKVEKRGWVFNF